MIKNYKIYLCILGFVTLQACGSLLPKKIDTNSLDVELVETDSSDRWFDEFTKFYYDLKGPVKRVVTYAVSGVGKENISRDGWDLYINRAGFIEKRILWDSAVSAESHYHYKPDNKISRIISYKSETPWRESEFEYRDDGTLKNIKHKDLSSDTELNVKHMVQNVKNGFYQIEIPVEKISLPRYRFFQGRDELIWSSKGAINNGLGKRYYIQTVDSVVSSRVHDKNTYNMSFEGGYRYQYENGKRLSSVVSLNAHDRNVFHITSYEYDRIGLLLKETKEVLGESLFNQAVNENVQYEYYDVDRYGNWLHRKVSYQSKLDEYSFHERRRIEYYP